MEVQRQRLVGYWISRGILPEEVLPLDEGATLDGLDR